MKTILATLLLTLCSLPAQTAGDYILTRKTADGYEPTTLTPEAGKVLSWDGSGNPVNTPAAGSWEEITGKPTTLAGYGITDAVSSSDVSAAGMSLIVAADAAAQRAAMGAAKTSWIDVTESPFNAAGDGVTDDTAAINAAIQSVKSTGGVIFLPRGTYRIRPSSAGEIPETFPSGPRSFLRLYSNVSLVGAGKGITTLKPLDTADGGPMINLTSTTNTRISDLTIDGNATRFRTISDMLGDTEGLDLKSDCRGVHIERVEFRDIQNEAIDIDWTAWDLEDHQIFVTDCTFRDIRGEGLHNANWSIVTRCQFINCGNGRLRDALNGVSGTDGQGAIDTQGHMLTVRDSHFLNCARAVLCYAAVAGNGLARASATITLTANPANNDTITIGGVVYTYKTTASAAREIPIGATSNLTARYTAEMINGDYASTTPDANVRALYSAPSLATGTPAMVTLLSKVSGTPGNSVTLAKVGANITVSGNLSGGGTGTTRGLRISNCIIEDSVDTGVSLTATDSPVVENSRFIGTSRLLGSSASGAIIRNNTFTMRSNLSDSVAVAQIGSFGVIDGNIITGGRLYLSGSYSQVSNNTITSAYGPLFLQTVSVTGVRVTNNTLTTSGTLATGATGTAAPIETEFGTGAGKHIITANVLVGGNTNLRAQPNCLITGNVMTGAVFNSVTIMPTGVATITGCVIRDNYLSQPINVGNVNNLIGSNSGSGYWDMSGSGSPESVVSAPVGSTYRNLAGGAAFTLWTKESGAGNTGWVGK